MNPIRSIIFFLSIFFCWIPLSQAQELELQAVTLQLQWKHQFEFAGFYAAIHKGFYAKHGLKVELREYSDGMDVVDEVLSGRVQYGMYNSSVIQARLEGKPVKLLANYFKRLALVLLASPEIESVADLRGKRLMIAEKDLDSPLLKLAFKQEGLQVGKDIEIIPHSFNSDAFIQGKVDAMSAFISNEPFELEQKSIDFNVIELSNYMRSMGEMYLFTSDDQADKHPEQTRNFIEASNEGWRYALEHKDEIVELILSNYSRKKNRDALLYEAEQTHKLIMPLPVPVGSIFKPLIVDVATLIMTQEGIEDKGYLQDFFFTSYSDPQEVILTTEERAYLDSTIFRRQRSYGWEPFSAKDKDGGTIGIGEEYWNLICGKLGIQEDATGEPILFANVLKKMQQGKTDLYVSTSRTKERETYAVFSEYYEAFPIAIAIRKGDDYIFNASTLEGKKVAVGKNYSAYHLLKARYPEIDFLQVTNTTEAIKRVVSGEAYAAVDILPVLQFQINRMFPDDMKLGGAAGVMFPVQIMVRKEHAALIPLLNRAIASITSEERTVIYRKWLVNTSDTIGEDTVDYTLLWQVLAGCGLLLAMIIIWNRRLAREISKRKQMATELQKLSRAVEQSPNNIVITDLNAVIEYVNPAFSRVTGYFPGEVIGKNPRILKSGVQKTLFYQKMWNDLDQVGVWKGELCNRKKDGKLYWEFATISSIKDDSGKTTHYVAVKEDISKRKKDEKEKEKLITQLHQAQKLESIGLMAGGVAHDLNNILAGVVGYPELILSDLPANSALRKPIEAIRESGKRAAMVVADMLTVARGAASIRECLDLNTIIQEYLDSPEHEKLRSLYPQVVWEYKLTADQPMILCSSVHVKKCLMNLAGNAAEAIGDQGSVTLSTTNRSINNDDSLNTGEYVVVFVQDTGTGIKEEDCDHIFEPFYSKKVMGKSGTGLGLTVVWNTMEDHDGKVTVKSDNKGTCFQLCFPTCCMKDNTVSSTVDSDETYTSIANEHILVVDDELQLRDIASQMLIALGYRVDVVSSGEEAIEFVQNRKVDLLVLDMLMVPGINGRQTYKEILKLYPDQKAIIVSGFSESDDVKTALDIGADMFIRKPYSMGQLSRAVRDALGR